MKNIVLVGMMGSGKSTLSHLLCQKTGYVIVDTDELIEKDSQISISEIFELYGEAHFRGLETSLLKHLEVENSIISTGGGMVILDENRNYLKGLGTVFYLKGSITTLMSRLTDQTDHRPLLSKNELKKQLETLLNTREDLYSDVADYTIHIDGKTADDIISEIYTILSDLDYKFIK